MTYHALVMCQEADAIAELTWKGLLHEVSQFRFFALTHLLLDVLPFLTRLSLKCMSKSLDFGTMNTLVSTTCESFEDFIECDGAFTDKLAGFVKEIDGKAIYERPVCVKKEMCWTPYRVMLSSVDLMQLRGNLRSYWRTRMRRGSPEICLSEYLEYKRLVAKAYPTIGLLDITKCERGFSTQNGIMTRLRTSLNNKNMDTLMRIREVGPPLNGRMYYP
ncbi:hypothetical protein MAR_010945 [Mya arenaria]|uniref:HAT C-terminal dimerisation domain-containing protein n=1 Tax=Mya arenaria TaxID=6604 RepID=A0ABY7G1L9_MYAAR|nr:hypothetical protein MAR_010945 [Mya arenaria]